MWLEAHCSVRDFREFLAMWSRLLPKSKLRTPFLCWQGIFEQQWISIFSHGQHSRTVWEKCVHWELSTERISYSAPLQQQGIPRFCKKLASACVRVWMIFFGVDC